MAYHLEDSDAKAYVCFEGTQEPRWPAEGWAGFNQAEGCETFFLITATPGADSPIEGAETLPRRGRPALDVRDGRDRGDRHRR